jgi:hypothetical protein
MKFKDIVLPFIILPVAILFVIFSFLVWINNGENKRFIKAKLRTGAIILSISWFVTFNIGCTCYSREDESSYISFKHTSIPRIHHINDTISGRICNYTYPFYSFSIYDTNNVSLQKGMVKPKDGIFNTIEEPFIIKIDTLPTPGKYFLIIYGEQTYQIKQDLPLQGAYFFNLL